MAEQNKKRGTFDVEQYANSINARVDSVSPDGVVQLISAEGKKGKFDVSGFLKSQGASLEDVNVIYNSPETATSENALSFTKQAGMIYANTPKQQLQYLQKEYGAENVVGENGQFKVKDKDGLWKKADTSWYNSMLAESPVIAASIAGTAKGATVGAALGPLGATAGGILGGVVSAGLAKYGEQKFAEMAGIRTEQDAIETAGEVGRDMAHNLIWDVATLGAGKVLKAISPFNKLKIANTIASFTGVHADDAMVAMRSASDAHEVQKYAELNFKAALQGPKEAVLNTVEKGVKELDMSILKPTSRLMARTFGSSIETAKKVAERNYAKEMQILDKAGVLDFSHMPINSVRNGLIEDLSKAGLLKEGPSGNFLFKSKQELGSTLVGVVDEKAQARLKHVYDVVEQMFKKQEAGVPGAAVLKNKPEIGELLKLKQFIGDVQEDLGHFMNPASVSSKPRQILSKSATEADRIFKIGANHITTGIDGIPAGKRFEQMNLKYSTFREGYDYLAKRAKDLDIDNLGSVKDMAKLAESLNKESGAHVLGAYKMLADSINSDAMVKRLTKLQQIKAGDSFSSTSGGSGVMGSIKSYLGVTPKNIGGVLTDVSESAHMTSGKLNPRALSSLVGPAKLNVFLSKLPKDAKARMLMKNDMLSELLQTTLDFAPMQQEAEQQLMQQVPR